MMKKAIALITIVILAGLLCTAGCTSQQAPATGDNTTPGATDTSILVYSGAGLKKPMNEIGAVHREDRYQRRVQLRRFGHAHQPDGTLPEG